MKAKELLKQVHAKVLASAFSKDGHAFSLKDEELEALAEILRACGDHSAEEVKAGMELADDVIYRMECQPCHSEFCEEISSAYRAAKESA